MRDLPIIPMIRTAAVALAALAFAVGAADAQAKTYVGSWNRSYDVAAYQHPRWLVLGPPNASLAESTMLKRIRWTGWGHKAATATAKTRFKTYDPWTKVRVKAFRRRSAHGIRAYTRIRTTADGVSRTWKTPSPADIAGYMD